MAIKLWETAERDIMNWIGEADKPIIKEDYGFDYDGTMPLTLDKFPIIQDLYEEGKGSNIMTAYDTDDLDNPTKWILYPTMVGGKPLDNKGIDSLLNANEHFGIYDSYDKMKTADDNIHSYFENLSKMNDKEYDVKSGPDIKGGK
tara:strand:+ start:1111 stop:1545 length:435 start_codon:yes stop_codon:yes gene_type:complete